MIFIYKNDILALYIYFSTFMVNPSLNYNKWKSNKLHFLKMFVGDFNTFCRKISFCAAQALNSDSQSVLKGGKRPPGHTQVHVWTVLTRPSLYPLINTSIHHPIVHSSVIQPSIHSCSQLAHTSLIQWLTCAGWINALLNGIIVSAYRHKGQVVFVQFISKVERPCKALTWANRPFSST